MAVNIFKLFGSIYVDNEEANKSIAKTDEKASTMGATFAKGVGTVGKWGLAIGTAATAAATAAVGGITKLATNAAATADNIDKMSQKLNISREAYQELDFICSQNGMSVDSLQGNIKKMTNVMDDMASGSETASAKFERLGLSATDSNGALKSSEDMFYETIAALQAMENETERNAAANDIFGGSYTEMLPLLNSGAESMEALKNQAHDMGLVIGDETIDAGVSLTDTMDKLKRSFSAVATNLGGACMPIVEKFANMILMAMPVISDLIGGLEPIFTSLMEQMLPPLMELAEYLIPIIIDLIVMLMPIIGDIASTFIPLFIDVVMQLIPPLVEVVQQILPPLIELLEYLMPVFTMIVELLTPILVIIVQICGEIITLVVSAIKPLAEAIIGTIKIALEPFIKAFNDMDSGIGKFMRSIFDNVMSYIDGIRTIFGGFMDFITGVFTGDWGKAWEGIKTIFKGVWDAFVGIVKMPINLIIGLVNGMVAGVVSGVNYIIKAVNKMSFKVPDWVPKIGGENFGFNLNEVTAPSIPYLEEGAEITRKGQMFVANENGPELVGSFDGRNAVINNQDVLKMVGETVKQVVSDAGQVAKEFIIHNVVYLDSDVIYENNERVRRDESIRLGGAY